MTRADIQAALNDYLRTAGAVEDAVLPLQQPQTQPVIREFRAIDSAPKVNPWTGVANEAID